MLASRAGHQGTAAVAGAARDLEKDPAGPGFFGGFSEGASTYNPELEVAARGAPAREQRSHCKLSLHLHPTDFDDGYSAERLTHIGVKGAVVGADCFPMVSGCNTTTQQPLFPCVQDVPIDSLIDASGAIVVTARISEVVDECPFEGNLLSGVPMVTCLISNMTEFLTEAPSPARPPPPLAVPPLPRHILLSAPLRCPERGCVAEAFMNLTVSAMPITQCLMTLRINQTDFDGDEGTAEQIEFVRVNNNTVVSDFSPGGNPCRSAWAGVALAERELERTVASDVDVTAEAASGSLLISTKITDFVDECAHDGYLLHGNVVVNCTLGAWTDTMDEARANLTAEA